MEVRLIDRLVVCPGALGEFRRRFELEYRPAAARRGMDLVSRWASPPIEVDGEPTEITLVWSVEGASGFFGMRAQASRDESVASFWDGCRELLVERHRSVVGEWA